MPDVLRLEALDYTGPTRWRWRLTDAATGAFLADHDVELTESDWQFEAFRDLRHYLSWHVNDDTYDAYTANETRIVTEVGDWVGKQIFGDAIMSALARPQHRNATVRVTLSTGAEPLAFLPLELSRSDGKTLAALGITLVIETGDAPAQPKEPVGERLRVLGLFSLPEQSSPLNLRRERHELVRLIETLAAHGRAADVTVLQYGVTRDRLRDVLTEAEGWDIIHVSGHGTPGELLLETADGTPDPVTADDLADLLDTARDRVKLVTIAACWSATRTADEQRRLLQLPIPDQDQTRSSPERITAPGPPPGALATELSARLGCAVLAMRYPVNDGFATALTAKLYDLLARQGQPLPRAVALTLRDLGRGDHHGQAYPALSLAAPAVFGPTATGLPLRAPDRTGPASYATENLKLSGFPPQPDRFVGRTAVMARASAALAAESRVPGVLLHGMPGGGKSACALELAYGHEDAFDRLVWFKAPDENMDISGALTDFALQLERDLPGFQMIHVLADKQKLDAFLPRLTELMERNRLLVVIDNAESLLTDSGQWRDAQWGSVVEALTAHTGLGRVILTSRRVPEGMDGLRGESVDALTADEALLLARELPHLRALIHGELPNIDRDTARKLALGVLNVAQGHPKLLELANGQAAHPEQLPALLEASGQSWQDQGSLPDGFFTTKETTTNPGDYLRVLADWTRSVTDTCPPGERDLFWFLCCMEEPDRTRHVLDRNWNRLWQRLGRDGPPLAIGQPLSALAARGLTGIRVETDGEDGSYEIHPQVAAAGRDHAGPPFQDAVDTEVAAYWYTVYRDASGENEDGTVHTAAAVRASLAAVPYLLRQQQWAYAATLIEGAFIWEPTRTNAAVMLPAIQRIARHDPRQTTLLARVLRLFDPTAAEILLCNQLHDAASRGDHSLASTVAGRLADLYRDSGRLAEAVTLADQRIVHTRQAGLGPWTQLLGQVQRLQFLVAMGEARHVIDDIQRLRRHLAALPVDRGSIELVPPWHVYEALLDTGSSAANELGRWETALAFNAEVVASKRARHASALDIASARFNGYRALLRLHRTEEALELLLDCRQVFHDAGNIDRLGFILLALSETEDQRGHGDAAILLARDALRYAYLAGAVTATAVCYHILGDYLTIRDSRPALASYLAAALIYTLTGIGGTASRGANGAVLSAVIALREFGAAAEPPVDIAGLCDRLADIEGTDLPGLIAKLSPDPETAEQTLRDLVAQARALAEEP